MIQIDDKKTILSWGMYDWANSAFATTVMAGFFPVFFKQFWCVGADITVSTARLGLANSLAGIMMALSAPILGAIADRGSSKKKFLIFFAYVGIVMTSALYMVSIGNWPLAILFYMIANIGFMGGNIFYDSLITEIASEKKMDSVSAFGFSLGYLGGALLFSLNVLMVLHPGVFGLADSGMAVKLSFLLTGIWWAVFSIPTFLFVKETPDKEKVSGRDVVKAGYLQLKETFREIRHLKNIFLFLLAYWFYIDGVDTIIRMAVDYGISIGFESKDLLFALLLTNFIGFPATLGFGYLGGKIETKKAIFIAIAVYFIISIWGAFIRSKGEFYILAIMIGMVQGGIQALSRSYYAKIIPINRSAEYFGFYNMVGKFAAIIGPALMGGAGLFVKSMGYSTNIASRAGITSISFLFLTGGIILYFVKGERVSNI